MPPTALRLAVFASACLALAGAAVRPRYGGVLRVALQEWTDSLDPSTADANQAFERIAPLVFERLTTIDLNGNVRPQLAESWTSDPGYRRWRFTLRRRVTFHDGTPLNASVAAAALHRWAAAAVSDFELEIRVPRADPLLPQELASAADSISRRQGTQWVGTGPFRVITWEPSRRAVLTAFENHRNGRPFLDSIEIEMGRPRRQQANDFALGRLDVVEQPPGVRIAGAAPLPSSPVELFAIVFEGRSSIDARTREALSLAIDRDSIYQALLDRQGAPAYSLLPEWISGFAHLFARPRDLALARERLGPMNRPAFTLAYDPIDLLAKAIAERVSVNARDVNLLVRPPAPGMPGDARLVRVRLTSIRPTQSLVDLAAALRVEVPAATAPEAERQILDSYRVIPLVHAVETAVIHSRVHGFVVTPWGQWILENAWLEAPPSKEPR
ncbi:MAG: ABC transporter substrate-binding protein [Bryobacteraceae bacterium]